MTESVGDFFASLKIKLDDSGINKTIKELQAKLSGVADLSVNIKGNFDHIQIDRDLKSALSKLGNNVVKIRTVFDPVMQGVGKKETPSMPKGEYLDLVAMDRLAKKKDKIKQKLEKQRLGDIDTLGAARASAELQANNQRLTKQKLVDRTIIKAADDFADITSGKLPSSVASLRNSIDNFNRMLSMSGKSLPFASRSDLKGRSVLPVEDINKAVGMLNSELSNLRKGKESKIGPAIRAKADDTEKLISYLRRQAIQVQQGGSLAPTQRAGGTQVLGLLKGRSSAGVTSIDAGFLAKYSEILSQQMDLAKATKFTRDERSSRTAAGMVSRDIGAGTFNTKMRNVQSRINQIEAEVALEGKMLSAIARDKNVSLAKARKSEEFKSSLIGGPTINPRKVIQQLEALKRESLKLEENHALRVRNIQKQIDTSSSAAHKEMLQRRLDATNKVFDQTYTAYQSLENNRAILTARAEEMIQRRREASLGGFIRNSREAITRIRDMSNNLILPFVAMSGFQKAAQVIGGAEGVRAGLQAVIEDSKEAADMFKFLEGETERLSTKLTDVGNPFMRLISSTRTANIGDDVAKRLFSGVLESAVKFNLDNQSVGRVITALDQIASKGQVLSEELEYRLAA